MKTSVVACLAALLVPFFSGRAQIPSPVASITPIATESAIASPTPTATGAPPTVSALASPRPIARKLIYKPPADAGNIPIRVAGGVRGEGGIDAALLTLVPNHVALTTQAQPSLFWFQSKPAKAKFELTIVEPMKPTPLLVLTSPDADKPGIHRIKVSRYKVELEPDVAYEWYVAIIPDPENRSKDIVAKGGIKRIKPPAELAAGIEKADDVERAALYAQGGIWYDTLEAISNAIEAYPEDASLREKRASLLKQNGLYQAAALDKK
jgi:Domain of Unknown Function (DUF928)